FVGLILAFGGRVGLRAIPWMENLRIGHSLYLGAVALCLGLAVVAEWIGVAAIIGAFLAGTALAEGSEETGLHRRVEDLTEFLLPFFLVSVGMNLEIASLAKPHVLALCAIITLLAVVGKLVGCGLPLWRSSRQLAIQVGWGMVPRGEVGIVVAQLGLAMGVLSADLYAVVLFMAIATTLIAPPMVCRTFATLPPEDGEGVVELDADSSSDLGHVPPGLIESSARAPDGERRTPSGA
ncbi:MAG TPA: cation:proton antiporter, partial [Armatimonadota bacterium]|nr:cation:proton antiporter [Armatimonadota bacterium]